MAKKAYIGVPNYKVIIEREMTYSSGDTWSWGSNASNDVNWVKNETYTCDVTIDGVTYPNLSFEPDVGASWFAVYPEVGDAVFEVYVAASNQFYDYSLGLDTATSHTIVLSTGNFNGVARKIKKGYLGIPTTMNVPSGKCNYHSMTLPALPEWDKTTYPYAYISYAAMEGNRLWAFSEKLQYVLSQGKCTPINNAQYIYTTVWDDDATSWEEWSSVKSATANSTYVTAPLWANVDVPYSEGSNILTTANEPEVLYEERSVGIARKIKKAYIGIGGVARPCWSGGELAYWGTTAEGLHTPRRAFAATTIDNFAAFGGGVASSSSASAVIDIYNKSLTHVTTGLTVARSTLAATTVGNRALFGGGGSSKVVDVYDTSFSRHNPIELSLARPRLAATSVGNYAVFAGGYSSFGVTNVEAYDTSLTMTKPTSLSRGMSELAATTVGNYALFGGGFYSANEPSSTVVNAYDSSLTRTILANGLSQSVYQLAATTCGDYAFFGGGKYSSSSSQTASAVTVYNASLTRSVPAALSSPRSQLAATSVGNYALFGGGYNHSTYEGVSIVDVYDASLTKSVATDLSSNSYQLAAATIGDYALFAGGGATGSYNTVRATVDVYTVA